MKSYKLIKEYPGSPQLGHVLVDTNTMEFARVQPNRYKEFWKEVPNIAAITSVDGVELCEGERCWIFNSNCTITNFIISKSYLSTANERQVFSSREAAEQFLIDEINLETEDGIVVGCNIQLYSLLPKANWDEKETTSLELWIRQKLGRNTSNWKYFRSKESRDRYVAVNKPIFSALDFSKVCRDHNVSSLLFVQLMEALKSLNK